MPQKMTHFCGRPLSYDHLLASHTENMKADLRYKRLIGLFIRTHKSIEQCQAHRIQDVEAQLQLCQQELENVKRKRLRVSCSPSLHPERPVKKAKCGSQRTDAKNEACDHDNIYEVDTIKNVRVDANGRMEYLIQWKHFAEDENSWVKSCDVKAPLCVNRFWARHREVLNNLYAATPAKDTNTADSTVCTSD